MYRAQSTEIADDHSRLFEDLPLPPLRTTRDARLGGPPPRADSRGRGGVRGAVVELVAVSRGAWVEVRE